MVKIKTLRHSSLQSRLCFKPRSQTTGSWWLRVYMKAGSFGEILITWWIITFFLCSNLLRFSPTAECFGVSVHIAFGVIRGTARPCRLVSPVPGTRVPGTQGSGDQGSGQGSGNPRFREPGSASFRRFREPGFREPRVPGFGARFREPKVPRTRVWARFREQWVLASFWVPGRQGSGIPRLSDKVPGTLGCSTMASSSQSLDCAKVLESPEHQFWNILETQSLWNQGSGKVLATLGSDKVPGTTAAADPEFGYTPWIMP